MRTLLAGQFLFAEVKNPTQIGLIKKNIDQFMLQEIQGNWFQER